MKRTRVLIVPVALQQTAGEFGINCEGHPKTANGSAYIPVNSEHMLDTAQRFANRHPGAELK